MDRFGLAALRVAVGVTFVAHGAQKLFGIWGGYGLSGTAAYFDSIGLSPGFPLAVVVALTEFFGGLLLTAGALTQPAAIALMAVMAGAIWKVHLANGFFLNWGITPGQGHGIEYNVVLVAALACLALTGPGALSVDHRRARSAEAYAAGRARLRGKL